jgi:3-phosphoshikimate 1-carboxyvinyltransferase
MEHFGGFIMKNIKIEDSKAYITPITNLSAEITASPSKAHTLRALFIASLADGETILKRPLIAEDQQYAIDALRKLGVKIDIFNDEIKIKGVNGKLNVQDQDVYIGASGATARFLAVMGSLAEKEFTIDGTERMREERPLEDLINAVIPLGITAEYNNKKGYVPIKIKPGFNGGETTLKGDKSSQFFTSILISAPYAKKDVIINTEGKLVSKPYIDVTISMMKDFGVDVINENYTRFIVKAGQRYRAKEYDIEGDYSSASFFFAMAAITGGRIKVNNLNPNSTQGDKNFVEFLKQMGCDINYGNNHVEVIGKPLKAIRANMCDYPDIVSPLAVVASFADGESEFYDISHLKYKECDRLIAPITELKKMGIDARCTDDCILIKGGNPHTAIIDTYKDHRMVMSFAAAGLKVPGMIINNPENVSKSFPNFFELLEGLYK